MIIVVILAVIALAGALYALSWNAGDITRMEEKENAECRMQNAE